jgi:hypothetical protein
LFVLDLAEKPSEGNKQKTEKTVMYKTFKTYETEIIETFEVTLNDDNVVVKALCKVCHKNFAKIKATYKGKVVEDVINFGERGTTHILKTNLVRHMKSAGHQKCLEIATGKPPCKKQRTLQDSFGTGHVLAYNALRPLVVASVYLGRKEKPYSQFAELVEVHSEMGMKLTSAFNNPGSAKVFNHIVADQFVADLRETVKNVNFLSWLIDGSTAAKRKLTYEAELLYIRTAFNLIPKIELYSFVPMKDYASVNSDNMTHALMRELNTLADGDLAKDPQFNSPDVPVAQLKDKLIESGLYKKTIAGGKHLNKQIIIICITCIMK